MGTQLCPPQKGGRAPSPIFGPSLLWPNCWMDQGGTWHGGGPWSRHIALDGDTAPLSQKGTEPLPILAHVYCGQTAGWIKTPLGTEVDRPRPLCIRRVPSYRRKRNSSPPPLFSAHAYCGHGRPSQLLLSSCTKMILCKKVPSCDACLCSHARCTRTEVFCTS